jgi:DNA-directed RNA polymerase beta subunit
MEPDYNFDKGIYARNGGKIVDIRVYHDKQINSPMPENIMSSLEKYHRATVRFYKEVLDTETQLNKERRHKHGEGNVLLKPGLHSLVVKAMAICNEKNYKAKQKLNMIYRTAPLPEYRVEFVIESTLIPTLGFKITDKHGGKGVICTIREDHEMPLASDGVRADVVMDSGSNIGRMNLGRIYEQYMGSCCVTIKKRMIDALKIEPTVEAKVLKQLIAMGETHPSVQICIDMLNTFFNITSPKQLAFFNNLSEKDKLGFIATSIVHELQLYWPIDNDVFTSETIPLLEKLIKPTYGPVTYTGLSGNLVTTKAKVRIAPLYMMVLEKIADSWSAVSSSKLQHFGVPAGMTKSEKFTIPYRSNPVKTAGETEARIFVSYLGEEAVAEMLDRSNNPVTHRCIVDNILSAENPTNINELIDRNIIPLGNSKPLQLLNHFAMCGGFKFKYDPETHI